MKEEKVVVQKVYLNQDKIDRLEQKVEMQNQNIKYQQDQYLKLLHKLDSKENFGLNCMLFTYEELIDILLHKYHPLHDYINRWFELDEDCRYKDSIFEDVNYNYELYFSEDAIEVEQDAYWLVNLKTDYAITFKDLSKLNRKIYELEKDAEKGDK